MKKMRFYCEKLQINYKKNLLNLLLKVGALAILSIVAIFTISYQVGIIILCLILPVYLIHSMQLESRYRNLVAAKEIAFFGFYRYLINMLENKIIIYNALKETVELIDEALKPDVLKLIEDIENDSSIQPFIDFSNQFENVQIKQMILILYQSQENAKNAKLLDNMGNTLFQIQNDSLEDYVEKEVKGLEKYYFFPLVLSALAIVLFSIFVFQQIEVTGIV